MIRRYILKICEVKSKRNEVDNYEACVWGNLSLIAQVELRRDLWMNGHVWPFSSMALTLVQVNLPRRCTGNPRSYNCHECFVNTHSNPLKPPSIHVGNALVYPICHHFIDCLSLGICVNKLDNGLSCSVCHVDTPKSVTSSRMHLPVISTASRFGWKVKYIPVTRAWFLTPSFEAAEIPSPGRVGHLFCSFIQVFNTQILTTFLANSSVGICNEIVSPKNRYAGGSSSKGDIFP